MKKYLAMLLVLVMVLSLFVGCAKNETKTDASTAANAATNAPEATTAAETKGNTESESKGVIYGIYKSGDQEWFINEGKVAEKCAKDAGYDFIYVDVGLNAESYLKAIDNAIANHAAGVVTCPPDQTLSEAVVAKLEEAKIPVVGCDDALQKEDGTKVAPWIGIDGYNIGAANGEALANHAIENNLVENPEVGLMLLTIDTVSSCVPRGEGAQDKFLEMCPKFDKERIFYADYDGTTDKGNVVSSATITAHPEIKVWLVTGANDEGCVGACRALESAGLDKEAYVIGMGGYLAKDEFRKATGSCMKGSTFISADLVGSGSIALLLDMIAGKEVEMSTATPAIMVTPENFEEVMGSYAD